MTSTLTRATSPYVFVVADDSGQSDLVLVVADEHDPLKITPRMHYGSDFLWTAEACQFDQVAWRDNWLLNPHAWRDQVRAARQDRHAALRQVAHAQ